MQEYPAYLQTKRFWAVRLNAFCNESPKWQKEHRQSVELWKLVFRQENAPTLISKIQNVLQRYSATVFFLPITHKNFLLYNYNKTYLEYPLNSNYSTVAV